MFLFSFKSRRCEVATIEVINYQSQSKSVLSKLLDYIQQESKTSSELIYGHHCRTGAQAFKDMMLNKQINQKRKTKKDRLFVHFTQNFAPGESTAKEVHEIGTKLLQNEIFKDYNIVMATHKDRNHLHNHFVIDTVNMNTGYKWQLSKDGLQRIKDLSDQLCIEHGLSIIQKQSLQEPQPNKKHREIKADEHIRSYKKEMNLAVSFAIKNAVSVKQFKENLDRLGYQMLVRGKTISFIAPQREGQIKPFRMRASKMEHQLIFKDIESIQSTIENNRKFKNIDALIIEVDKMVAMNDTFKKGYEHKIYQYLTPFSHIEQDKIIDVESILSKQEKAIQQELEKMVIEDVKGASDIPVTNEPIEVLNKEILDKTTKEIINFKEHKLYWKKELTVAIKLIARVSTSREDFIAKMAMADYTVNWSDERKYITIDAPGHKRIRTTKLYPKDMITKENLLKQFERNVERIQQAKAVQEEYRQAQEEYTRDMVVGALCSIDIFNTGSYDNNMNTPFKDFEGQAQKDLAIKMQDSTGRWGQGWGQNR
jgi:hypothetical protein